MYTITREDAALKLNLSTRSIDRYIKSGKIRAKKEGKIVYIHNDDVNNFMSSGTKKQEIINTNKSNKVNSDIKEISKTDDNIVTIFDKLRQEISSKDEIIKDLSVKMGKMEEIVKNSISLLDYKKNQYLLEESKTALVTNLEETSKNLEIKKQELKEEKRVNFILLNISVLLFITLIIIWFIQI